MSYIIGIYAIGKFPEVSISKKQFLDLNYSNSVLSHGLSIEEKYEILLSNYLEFEEELLKRSAEFMLRIPFDHEDFFEVQLEINRNLVNLLTSARLYVDQISQHVQEITTETSKIGKARGFFDKEYDNNLEYRFMDALRNYVQHRELPVHLTRFNCLAKNAEEQRKLEFSVEVFSEKLKLFQDKRFKQSILKQLPEKINLKSYSRSYIASLSKIHVAVRLLIKSELEGARQKLEDAIISYKSVFKEDFIGLYALHRENEKIIEKVPLVLKGDDTRLLLVKRNGELKNLTNRYISSEVKEE